MVKESSILKEEKKVKKIYAQKDFVICANSDFFEIKQGDDIEALNIPEKYFVNLKTEGVIK